MKKTDTRVLTIFLLVGISGVIPSAAFAENHDNIGIAVIVMNSKNQRKGVV